MMVPSGFSYFLSLISSFLLLPITIFMGLFSFNNTPSYDKTFGDYVTKVYIAGQNKYLSDISLGGEVKECYGIDELGLSSDLIKGYSGYVCLHSSKDSSEKMEIYVSVKNSKYTTLTKVDNETYDYINYSVKGEPIFGKIDSVEDYNSYYVDINTKISKNLKVIDGKPVNEYEI